MQFKKKYGIEPGLLHCMQTLSPLSHPYSSSLEIEELFPESELE